MTTKIQVGAAQKTAELPVPASQLSPQRASESSIQLSTSTLSLTLQGHAAHVVITTRPLVAEKAESTQRFNRSLELGYTPPVKSTSTK